MIFLWTKSPLIGSKLIRWGTGEDSSHFAVCFFEQVGMSSPVLESRLGHTVGIDFMGDFLDRNEVVHALKFQFQKGEQQKLFMHMGKELQGQKYDDWGILYWSYRILLRKAFGTPIPNANEWGRNNQYYCVEVMIAMREFLVKIGIDVDHIDFQMTTPGMAYTMLKDNPHLIDVTEWFNDYNQSRFRGKLTTSV